MKKAKWGIEKGIDQERRKYWWRKRKKESKEDKECKEECKRRCKTESERDLRGVQERNFKRECVRKNTI